MIHELWESDMNAIGLVERTQNLLKLTPIARLQSGSRRLSAFGAILLSRRHSAYIRCELIILRKRSVVEPLNGRGQRAPDPFQHLESSLKQGCWRGNPLAPRIFGCVNALDLPFRAYR